MNKAQIEILYNQKKKNMVVAYLLGALLGGFGVHYFYAGRVDFGLSVLGLFAVAVFIPNLFTLYLFCIAVWGGMIHTYFVVEASNKKIHKEVEVLYGESD